MTAVTSIFDSKWEDYDEKEYKTVREAVEVGIKHFISEKCPYCGLDVQLNEKRGGYFCPSGHEIDKRAIAVVGPFGCGKTALLYHAFKYSWKENKIPAFYLTLGTLAEELKKETNEKIRRERLPEKIKEILDTKKRELARKISNDEYIERDSFLPDVKMGGVGWRDYFGKLGVHGDDIINILNNEKAIFLIDEVERGYESMKEVVESPEGLFRSFFEEVEKHSTPYYALLSFGYVSLWELLSGDEGRRVKVVQLPILNPDRVEMILEKDRGITNFVWWLSRGRMGWLQSFVPEGVEINNLTAYHDFFLNSAEVRKEMIAGVKHFDEKEFNKICGKVDKELISYLIFNSRPVSSEELFKLGREEALEKIKETINRGGTHYISLSKKLVSKKDLFEAFIVDLNGILKDIRHEDAERHRGTIERYFSKITGGIANSDEELCVGTIRGFVKIREDFPNGFIAPLINLMHDISAEFEESIGEVKETINLLYKMSYDFGTADDPLTAQNTEKISNRFRKTLDLFEEVSIPEDDIKVDEEFYISLSLNTLEKIYPMLITDPVLRFEERFPSTLEEQVEILKEKIRSNPKIYEQFRSLGKIIGGE